MRKQTFTLLGLLLVFALILSGCSSSKTASSSPGQSSSKSTGDYPKMAIKFSHVAAEDTPKGQAALEFKNYVEKNSGGNIKVQVYPNSQLYGDKDELQALQANNVQFIAPSSAKLAGFNPTLQLFDLPFLFKNDKALYSFEDSNTGQKLIIDLGNSGLEGLGYLPNGFTSITNNKHPIVAPSDLKGLKIRTHGGPLIGDVYSQLGASSTELAFSEVYQALQLGTVDGEENSLVNIETQKYGEVQKYLTITNNARSEYIVVTNKKWFDGLNSKTQKLFKDAMKAAQDKGRSVETQLEEKALADIKSSGQMKVTTLTDSQLQAFIDAEKPVMDKWKSKLDSTIVDAAINAGK